ncbi:hypothetical protein POM88_024447 [Heracleum sosnowskyi]|uniref:F-box associated beta-propeller type 3 domain-containing protein n=1 Tax=Heracleum sosnowskyi TaxID=360622 RepID=A0AAD8MMV7_9APIA|nr:hypothetical protein POM88_024447 [Heracleum sosnowskyi]
MSSSQCSPLNNKLTDDLLTKILELCHYNNISLLNLRAAQPQSTINCPFLRQGELRTKLVVVQGFGYDPVDDDFKIVRVVSYPVKVEVEEDVDEVQEVDSEVRVDVEVYSAKLNAWRKLEQNCLPQEIIECQTANYDICVNGILCCIAEGFSGIIAFDLNQEVFNCDVEFPVSGNYYRIISINDSTIGLITVEEFGGEFNLWKLDDVECLRGGSGLEPSWSLMLGINVGFECMPLNYYNSGHRLLLDLDMPILQVL